MSKDKRDTVYPTDTIILPQDKEVARLLKLPRHLIMMDPDPGEPNQTCNHPQYTEKVEKALEKVIDEYRSIAEKGEKKPCSEPVKVELDIEKLNKLSRNCYKTIVDFGRAQAGNPLDSIKALKEPEKVSN